MKILSGLVLALGVTSVAIAGSYKKDIVETASAAGTFDTLIAAVKAADLSDTLKGDGPFTVFAPSDDAFAALPAGTLEDLLKPESREKLVELLSYHVVEGNINSADVVQKMTTVENLAGSSLSVNGTSGVMVNQAAVTQADIVASNGVIHVIDKVILPKAWQGS